MTRRHIKKQAELRNSAQWHIEKQWNRRWYA